MASTPTRPAERDTALVIGFLNTIDEEADTDLLEDSHGWQRWARKHGPGRVDPVETARAVRRAIRAAVLGGAPSVVAAPAIRVELAGGSPALVADTVVGAVLAAAARLATTGEWSRIKICPAANCGWAFHDASRNRSRTWCSMRVCGNRAKARTWRNRRR